MDKVPLDNVILDEFYRLAIVTPEEKEIIRTRCYAGWSQVKQCHAFNMSLATLNRRISRIKEKYAAVQKYSDILPDIDTLNL